MAVATLLVAAAAAAAPAGASAAPVASFTIPAGTDALPTISAGHGLVGWSSPTPSGRWGLRLASDGADLGVTFDSQRWPVDVSIGTVKGAPQVLFSRCAASSTAVSRAQATGCDLERLSSVTPKGRPISLGRVNTKSGSEYAPSRDGDALVFARRLAGSKFVDLQARAMATGRETALAGGPNGVCNTACQKAGEIAGGPLESSVDGRRYATRWESTDTTDSLGIAANDEILRTTLTHSVATRVGQVGLVSGTCSEVLYGSVQQIGTTTQMVRRGFSCDNATPAPGDGEVVQRVDGAGKASRYADPQGRRIIAAAADGSTLWVIREAQSFPYSNAAPRPGRCSAEVGGCVVEAVDNPTFTPYTGSF